jgi:preprotein translocase subunit SecD
MKISFKIWVLWLFIVISIISIIPSPSTVKFIVFLLLIGSLLVTNIIKSKPGSLFISALFILITIFLIINSIPTGALITSVDKDSPAFQEGLRKGQIIISINNKQVTNPSQYLDEVSKLFPTNNNIRFDIATTEQEYTLFINQTPNIVVKEVDKTKIKTGLDISGGARALVSPTSQVTEEELQDLISVSRERFNVFGLSDVKIKGVTDFSGNKFMLVEVAGATPNDLESLISEQGKFEAKIGNETVFIGGDKDITHVYKNDATQSTIYPAQGSSQNGYFSRFQFTISLSPEAAQRHADITRNIPTDPLSSGQYLSENLTLILDGEIVDELRISSGLKGQVTTQISIQGSGSGPTSTEALSDARIQMNKLQTILISGSLPFELEIVKLDSISPQLGAQFTYSILLAGTVAILLVGLIIFARYKKFKISIALLATAFSEVLIILGIASLIKWNLDLPSIAGILATIGTGVDQQIIIIDEANTGKESSIKQRIKRAIFVVMTAYLTTLVALMPLFKAGAGLFQGFAITTIIGITAGVFITRPAFAEMVNKIESQ